MKNFSSGFSLIELMIVVSIVTILASIAIPSYQTYTQRARFAELIQVANFFKTAVTLAILEGAPIETIANGSYGIPSQPKNTKNLASLSVEKGVITAIGTELLNKVTYLLIPSKDGTTWTLGGSCLKLGLCHA